MVDAFTSWTVLPHGPLQKTGTSFVLPTGTPAVPRVVRWLMVKHKKKLRAQLETLARTKDSANLIVAHGKPLAGATAAEALRLAASRL